MHIPEREMVVAHYDEPIDWMFQTDIPVWLYNKGRDFPLGLLSRPNTQVQKLPNVGRESHTYLTHIVNNYDRLADLTFFVQGEPLVHSPDLLGRLKCDYEQPTTLTKHYLEDSPPAEVKSADYRTVVHGFECNYGLVTHPGQFPFKKPSSEEWAQEIWTHVFDVSRPETLYYGYGNMYAVPRQCITVQPARRLGVASCRVVGR